ncbi:DNA-protecting protein DprA [Spongiibacter nanhainus]|uniref:DNA-protecting protein DprA n=1 Tax=Spongiibacter nanhainus TaxID=2794344 RepID=A0A7T4R0T6_9GAMM|nr:DNA-processing protein DprA [Spongiibacter nanhainus]QQD18313.1 DNA-protecting protein DprA [Spongiibacter nanhainus]
MDSSALAWLCLQQQADIPAPQWRALHSAVTDPRALNSLSPQQRQLLMLDSATLDRWSQLVSEHQLTRFGTWLDELDLQVLSIHDAAYPALLKEISDPPELLFYRGQLSTLDRPMLAMVGSRRPSRRGADDARDFADILARAGMGIASGMALGIDAAAHRGALAAEGATVAVLGTGADICYPRSHRALYDDIAQRGLILSELPPGSPPLRHHFPRRNRLISGLSLGVLVVEAAIKSGSLITARLALEQNREVFALPGSIHNPASRGCNGLIRSGAKLVESIDDILEELSGWTAYQRGEAAEGAAESPDSAIYRALGYEPMPVDALAGQCQLPIAQLLAELAELELEGWVEQQASGWQRRR